MPSTDAPSDEALAADAAGGSRRAFEVLVDRYGARVLSVLRRQLNDADAALDLAQESWIRVFHALPRFQPDAGAQQRRFRSWLFAIVLNAARDEGRRRRRSRVVYVDDLGATSARLRAVERTTIDEALDAVPEPYRTAVQLVDVEGLAYDEAALSAGCAVGTMKSRVHRGRTAFRGVWEKLSGGAVPTSEARCDAGGRR